MQKGKISQIIGPVIDVVFENEAELPKIYDSMTVKRPDGQEVVLEVQQHTGENTVRSIAMDSTDGLQRGQDVTLMGSPIKMPKGKVFGRLFNVIGDPIDGMEPMPKDGDNGSPIHKPAPKFDDLSTSTEPLYTGIKVIDLIEPYSK